MTPCKQLRLTVFVACLACCYGCVEVTCAVGGKCLSEADRETIENWMLCEECEDDLDRVLDEIGWRAIRRLAGALERPPLQDIDQVERRLRDSHRRTNSPLPQAGYVAFYRDNYIAQYQKRAAIALGQLAAGGGYGSSRARGELENAIAQHEGGLRSYRDDVLAEIHRALREATGTTVWEAVTTGDEHSCGLTTSGDAYCWGANDEGQLGDGTIESRASPVPVARHIRFTSLGAGSGPHTCGVSSSNYAYCWGNNTRGELGDGTINGKSEPTPVAGRHPESSSPMSSIGGGGNHTCADSLASGVFCWGANDYGQVGMEGNGVVPVDTALPVYVTGSADLGSVTLGSLHTCALRPSNGAVHCWGRNLDGQLGDDTNTDRETPGPITLPPGTAYADVDAGGFHTCALTNGGAIHCWGRNHRGQLGDGTTEMRTTPVPIVSTETFEVVTAGLAHTCAVTSTGDAYCWGDNEAGQLGDGSQVDRLVPVLVAGGQTFASLDAGDFHTCGVTTDGEAYCWGGGSSGQLGNGDLDLRLVPTRVAEPTSP